MFVEICVKMKLANLEYIVGYLVLSCSDCSLWLLNDDLLGLSLLTL